MPYDWNHNGKEDWEDQMMEDDFDDFMLQEVMKRISEPPPIRKTQTSSSTKIRASIVPGSDSKNKVPPEYRHGRAYRHAWIQANIPHMVILGIAFLCFAFVVGKMTGMLISVFLTMPFAMFVCHYYAWDVPDMKDLVRTSVALSAQKSETPEADGNEMEKDVFSRIILVSPLLILVIIGIVLVLYVRSAPYDPSNPSMMVAAKHFFEETGCAMVERRLRSCGDAPLKDISVKVAWFKKEPYPDEVTDISCVLRFHSEAISQYADVQENSDKAFELRNTMEAIEKELEKGMQSSTQDSAEGKFRLIYEPESSLELKIIDADGTIVQKRGAYVKYGDRYITVVAPWATSYGLKKAEEKRQKEEEQKKREENALKNLERSRRRSTTIVKEKNTSDSTARSSDTYDVYDYNDPEDFYYDHEDEFEDYEDAEDYFDEAWDE